MNHLLRYFLLLLLALAARAQTDYKDVLVERRAEYIELRLPLTNTSGAVRPKRRGTDGLGETLAPTKTPLGAGTYLEWQISYDTTETTHPSLEPAIRFQRDARTKTGCELSRILADARRIRLLSKEELEAEHAALAQVGEATIAAAGRASLVPETDSAPGASWRSGFTRFVQKTPFFSRDYAKGRIEIQLRPQQRAAGWQPFVFLCLPCDALLDASGAPRPARPARSKETAHFRIGRAEAPMLLDLIRAFGVASTEHNNDMREILTDVIALD